MGDRATWACRALKLASGSNKHGIMTTTEDIVRPLALTASLIARFWPQLLLIGAIGYIASDLLLKGAVAVGLQNPLGGMIVLSLVVLTKLLVVVMMFAVLRPGLPALASLRQASAVHSPDARRTRSADHMLAATAAVILPFFAFYAAWGFLGDTVRVYSRMALDAVPFGERADIFELLRSRGLIASIVLCWLICWFAKRMNDRSAQPLLAAAHRRGGCKLDLHRPLRAQRLEGRVHHLDRRRSASGGIQNPSTLAPLSLPRRPCRRGFHAGGVPAARSAGAGATPFLLCAPADGLAGHGGNHQRLRAVGGDRLPLPRRRRAPRRGESGSDDFVAYFFSGYRSRYQPVWTCLRLTLGAGLATLITLVIAYRLIGWLGAWLWYGATRTLGVPDLDFLAGRLWCRQPVHRQSQRPRRRHIVRCRSHRTPGRSAGILRRLASDGLKRE